MRKKVDGIENSAVEIGEGSGKATSSPIASASVSGSDFVFKSGEVVIVDAPLSAAERIEASKGGNPAVSMAKVAVGVSAGFDAQKPWPILIVSATVTAPNIDLLNLYKQAALDEGWLVMAADGPEKPKDDSNSWRLAMIGAGLDYMAAKWPASKTWPVACGGMSGGAKRTGFVATALAKEGRNVIGMLMGGCNQDMATMGLHEYRPPSSAFKNVPIFLSSGANDTIATPSQTEYVRGSMKGTGFRKLRLESFSGAHDVYAQHTTEALRWFIAESSAAGSTPRPASNFDQFFKKKP